MLRRSSPDWLAMRDDMATVKSDVRDLHTQVIGTKQMPGAIPQLRDDMQHLRADIAATPAKMQLIQAAKNWRTSTKVVIGLFAAVAGGVLTAVLVALIHGGHP